MENNFWANLAPKIRRWLCEGAEAEIEEIQCPICQQSDLGLPGFSPPPRPSTTDTIATEDTTTTTRPQESALILACGHIVGATCGRTWFLLCAQQSQPLTCPICRFDLGTNRCPQHRSQDGIIAASNGGGGEGENVANGFEELAESVDQFLHVAARNEEAARSCTLCTSNTGGGHENVAEPVLSITLPGDPPVRYTFSMDRFIGSDDVFSDRFVVHLRSFGLDDAASLWEEYRASQGS